MSSVPRWGHRAAAVLAFGLIPSSLAIPAHATAPAGSPAAPREGVVVGADEPGAVPGRYIVTLKPGVRSLAAGNGTTYTARMSAQQARRVAADPSVGVVEQDRIVRIDAVQRRPVWGLDRIDQRSRTGSRTYRPMTDGSSVRAYVIDTGIKINHRQFGGRATYGWDFAGDDRYADDCSGHGTHVAGTIGGATYGVAKRVRLVAVRVLDCKGSGYLSDIIDGVEWVTANAVKPAVVNMSLGGAYSESLEYAVRRSIYSGLTYVVAAGNSNRNAAAYSPAGVPAAITVAATDSRDRRARFSNWGSTVDLFAPGVGIRSAYRSSTTATAVMSGTSMAAPHVAGAAAMVLDAAPTWTPRQVRDYLVRRATTGRVADRKSAPNRLLFVPGPPAAPVVRAAKLPYGKVGVAYRAQLRLKTARRGTWRVASGALPAGLTLSRSGVISGTPTAATSTRRIVVRFTDYVPQSATRTFFILVRR